MTMVKSTSERRFRPYSLQDLRELPYPSWQVDQVLPTQGLVVVYGRPGEGKTFVMLDLALCVATGQPWHGHETVQGTVIYVSAEGTAGVRTRAEAWEQYYQQQAGEFFVVREAVPLLDPGAVDEFIATIRDEGLDPSLLVFDTLARCFGTGDENSTQDMNAVVAAVGRCQAAFGCTVVLVHHSGHTAGRERGSTALRGAADTMLQVTKTNDRLSLTCDKQKDAEEHRPIGLQLQTVPDLHPEAGHSCVVVAAGEGATCPPGLTGPQLRLLATFPAGTPETTTAAWMTAAQVPERTFYKTRQQLLTKGLVERQQKGLYALTPKATVMLQHLHRPAPATTTTGIASAAPAPPLKGVQDSSSLQESEA